MSILDRLQPLLEQSLARHRLPGAVLAVLADGRIYEAAAGVVNASTGVACTPDSPFMFGSVAKTVTATMALRLVDQGAFGLDDLVRDRVPEFAPFEPDSADQITLRHLLSHSSGLVGSIFQDTGRNADALARQVELINAAPPFHEPGELLSYCNSGYLLLGRAIEIATGRSWDQAVQSLAAEPLGLDAVVTRAEQALRFNTGVGHVIDPATGRWIPIPEPFSGVGHGPAGSTMAGRARDLVRLVQAYAQGKALQPSTVAEAWSVQAPALAPGALLGWGLGWMVFDWGGKRIVGHDGSTAGTKSFLRYAPAEGVAVALMVNAQAGVPVYEDVLGPLFDELVGAFEILADQMPTAPLSAIADCAGLYADSHLRMEVTVDRDGARIDVMPNAVNPIHRPVLMSYPIHPFDQDAFYSTGQAAIFYPPAGDLHTRLTRVSRLARTPAGEVFLCGGANIYRRLSA